MLKLSIPIVGEFSIPIRSKQAGAEGEGTDLLEVKADAAKDKDSEEDTKKDAGSLVGGGAKIQVGAAPGEEENGKEKKKKKLEPQKPKEEQPVLPPKKGGTMKSHAALYGSCGNFAFAASAARNVIVVVVALLSLLLLVSTPAEQKQKKSTNAESDEDDGEARMNVQFQTKVLYTKKNPRKSNQPLFRS